MKIKYTTHVELDGFECQRCGKCCMELKNIMLPLGALAIMADKASMSVDTFKLAWGVSREGDKYLIKMPCPMYQDGCLIYEDRPPACRCFPLMKVTPRENGELDILVNDMCTGVDTKDIEGFREG